MSDKNKKVQAGLDKIDEAQNNDNTGTSSGKPDKNGSTSNIEKPQNASTPPPKSFSNKAGSAVGGYVGAKLGSKLPGGGYFAPKLSSEGAKIGNVLNLSKVLPTICRY